MACSSSIHHNKILASVSPNKILASASPKSLSRHRSSIQNQFWVGFPFICSVSSASHSTKIHAALPLQMNRRISPLRHRTAQIVDLRNCTWVIRAQDEDFEADEAGDFEGEKEEEEENSTEDYETDPEPKSGDHDFPESDTFVSTEGEEAEMVVDYKIDEDEFHRLSLNQCDFFIRKVPDPDEDVYDFREMYVTAPDTDIYAIPRVEGRMPRRRVRMTKSHYEHICVTEPAMDGPRSPLYHIDKPVMKVFLFKHYRNRRKDAWNFALDFEEIYVIDSKTKCISRAKVTVCVPGGKYRDRSDEVLTVNDDGTSFRVIPKSKRRSPDEIIGQRHWRKTKEAMTDYLRGFRDYEVSNWF